ncbi:MAG: rRNA maturation RNase YbeY [Desulfobacterium sp.]|nr:rRNA maturation RNase YbeY [Desulfobacterium sp.]
MGILISNRQERLPIMLEKIRKKAQVILNALGSPESELSIVVVGDSEIASLNSEYLHRKGPTNVIAFPMQEGEFSGVNPGLLGDVVISIDTAEKESKVAGIDIEERFDELLVHGILHLFGYDHVSDEGEAQLMEEKSHELLILLRKDGGNEWLD